MQQVETALLDSGALPVLGKALNTLGKGHSEKKWLAKQPLPSAIFRTLGKASTRQRKGIVTAPETVTAALPSASPTGTRQIFFHLAKFFLIFFKNFFAECRLGGTR
jgi:hypothetical protein